MSGGPDSEPLLAAEDLRVDVEGTPACDGIALRTRGRRVLVLGAPRALFEATSALLPVMRGDLRVRGAAPVDAVRRRLLASAAMDPPMPPRWTVLDYVTWSARLAGVSARAAREAAHAAIERTQLGAMAKTQLSRLVPHARRATVVASALATGAGVIALEDPLGGLTDDVAAAYAKVLVEALDDRAWLVFAPRMALASPFGTTSDEVVVASATQVEHQGPPAEIGAAARCFVGRILGSVTSIAPALASRGGRVEERGARLFFELGDRMTTGELMAICADAGVAVVELAPVARALS